MGQRGINMIVKTDLSFRNPIFVVIAGVISLSIVILLLNHLKYIVAAIIGLIVGVFVVNYFVKEKKMYGLHANTPVTYGLYAGIGIAIILFVLIVSFL